MTDESTFSICGMCTMRCPILVETRDGQVDHIWGNPHALGGRQLCPRGAAGKRFLQDRERPQGPMLRRGARGSGQWEQVSWERALDEVASRLDEIRSRHGGRALALSDRGGPHGEFHKTFLRAFGSPNYFTHHATCSNSLHNAHMSIAGLARNDVAYDYGRCRMLVTFGRNLLEAMGTSEARQVVDLIGRGGKFVHIDVRWNYTAAKATEFYLVRPGTDYAIALAVLHVLIFEALYDPAFVDRWVQGLDALAEFVRPYTPAFAERESGMPAQAIYRLARELAAAAPHVVVHPGYMAAWGSTDFYLRRALYAINALLGTYEAPGGIVFNKGPGQTGHRIRQLSSLAPEPEEKERIDGVGTCCQHLGRKWGMVQLLARAARLQQPYALKGYIAMRHDPLASLPDPDAFFEGLDHLDLIVAVDVNWSETAWRSDVVLPEASYLERTDNVIVRKGPRPRLALRRRAVEPRSDVRPRWWIFKQLAERLGLGTYFPFETVEDHIAWQLEETPWDLHAFDATGEIALSDEPILYDRERDLPFKTPSGKIELVSDRLPSCGVPCWAPYESPPALQGNRFRMITGKVAVHTQGRTTANNDWLGEIVPDNPVHLPAVRAEALGIRDGDRVALTSGAETQVGVAKVTPWLHADAVFLLHGFGDTVPVRSRSHGRGIHDGKLAKGKLQPSVGGNCPLTETVVTVTRAADGRIDSR